MSKPATITHRITKEGRDRIRASQKTRWAKVREAKAALTAAVTNHSPKRPMASVDEDSFQRGVIFGLELQKKKA